LTASIVKKTEAFDSEILGITAALDLEVAAAAFAAPDGTSSRTGTSGERGVASRAVLVDAVDAGLNEPPFAATIGSFEGTTEAFFLATVEVTVAPEESCLAFPGGFAVFELRTLAPALELAVRGAFVLPVAAAFEPSGVVSAFEALRKERPIAAEATTLGAIAIQMSELARLKSTRSGIDDTERNLDAYTIRKILRSGVQFEAGVRASL
jgi:hypothetical protein